MADEFPTTSYSDPFYDRLDAIARFIKRAWLLVLVVIILVIAAVVGATWLLQRHPLAGSAARLLSAHGIEDAAKQESAYRAVAEDATVSPSFRARAQVELVQLLLSKGDTATAIPAATRALELATQGQDAATQLDAKLSLAAAAFQAGDFVKAAAAYTEAKRGAGAKYPVASLEASLGLARTLIRQNKPEDAIAELEPVIVRADRGSETLIELARFMYWEQKRLVGEAKAAPAAAAAATPAPAAIPVPAAGPTPTAAPAAPTVEAQPAK